METWRSGGIASCILNLGTRWGLNGQLHALAALPLGNKPPIPIGWEGGWHPEAVRMLWRREKSLSPARNGTMISWSSSP
jgi:hypothetical protein